MGEAILRQSVNQLVADGPKVHLRPAALW